MRRAEIHVRDRLAGTLEETDDHRYVFSYLEGYNGPPVSLTLPTKQQVYSFKKFPAFFEGLLPEGSQLEALLRTEKLDRQDYLGQLITVGNDLVGAVTVKGIK